MRALVVEDDAQQRKLLCDALSDWGFLVFASAAGLSALVDWEARQPDVVLLDLGLPDMDGLDVLQSARRKGLTAPVLLLSARTTLGDRVLGLNLGADDYLIKPYDFKELKARMVALLRRGKNIRLPAMMLPPSHIGKLSWDKTQSSFYCDEPSQSLPLSTRERALLRALVDRPNQAISREVLARAVFPRGNVLEPALEVVAHRLRKKLATCGVAIMTLRGLGYLIKASPGLPQNLMPAKAD